MKDVYCSYREASQGNRKSNLVAVSLKKDGNERGLTRNHLHLSYHKFIKLPNIFFSLIFVELFIIYPTVVVLKIIKIILMKNNVFSS